MTITYLLLLCLLIVSVLTAIYTHKLTIAAAITGGLIAVVLFAGLGYASVIMMAIFFMLGNVATSIGMHKKVNEGLAETNKGKRTIGQVFANGGVAGILGLSAWIFPSAAGVFSLLVAASFASATADTLSSELGNVYGSNYYNILTLKKDTKGLNGVISVEGTILGIAGSIVITLIYAIGFGFGINAIIIIIAGTIGNVSDSVLGATLERSKQLNNNAVNFLNTFIAAAFAYAMLFF